jgi:hypothetical protein
METKKRCRPDPAAGARDAGPCCPPLERIAAALGHSATIFTEGAAVEARLAETAELLQLWSQVREPDATRRILAFAAAVVAEQG